jgi:hypothetical protein
MTAARISSHTHIIFLLTVSAATVLMMTAQAFVLLSQEIRSAREVATIKSSSSSFPRPTQSEGNHRSSRSLEEDEVFSRINIKVGDLLCDFPTPCLLLELSLAENAVSKHFEKRCSRSCATERQQDEESQILVQQTPSSLLDAYLQSPSSMTPVSSSSLDDSTNTDNDDNRMTLDGCLFIHTTVVETLERDVYTAKYGASKCATICLIDFDGHGLDPLNTDSGAVVKPNQQQQDSYYLGIGLANHHVGGYYWARGMGIGASLPAHGISVRRRTDITTSTSGEVEHRGRGELYWKKRGAGTNAYETTEESSNSNDGKRSEWADFLQVGDAVQLVPTNATNILWPPRPLSSLPSQFQYLVGVRRQGRPLGADPIVEKIWERRYTDDGVGCGQWIPVS